MKVEKNHKVTLHYEGSFDNGDVFDKSEDGDPLEFVVGSGQVIKGFDDAVLGMEVSEEKVFEIEPKDAYGELNPELRREVPRKVLPQDREPEVGMDLMMMTPEGQQIPAKIIKVGENEVTIDLNHPLAGKKLNFKIKINKIESGEEEKDEEKIEEEKDEKKKDEEIEEKVEMDEIGEKIIKEELEKIQPEKSSTPSEEPKKEEKSSEDLKKIEEEIVENLKEESELKKKQNEKSSNL